MSGLPAAEQAQINTSLGAVVVSNYLSYLTMGIVLSATWTYFSKFPSDPWYFKVPVILCVGLCIADTVATGMLSYDWAVTNYANPTALGFIHWSLPAEAFFLSMCGLIVQLFFAWRLWVMSLRKNWILPTVVGCLSVMGWCTMCWVVQVLSTHHLIMDFGLLLPVIYIWLGGSVGADVIITGSMIYYLDLRFRGKRQTDHGYHAPQRFRRIIVRTVECNLLSLLAQAVAVGLFNQSRVGFWFVITDMTLAKVYTFSLLVSCMISFLPLSLSLSLSSERDYFLPYSTVNNRQTDNGLGISKKSVSSYRGDVELNALSDRRTSSHPGTQVSLHIQREITSDWQGQPETKEPAFDDDECTKSQGLPPV
ncbi:hypothetical protein BT96DRAFT_1025609 [Gymnopus androsaceus JB14]|uniref:DUF6534 domain-containing protein n=1 Tax=Gymnopus androsaceus JB14 TaxID=1447944 RepID=A0A6A4GQL6_9AGAR|nr:hypothetical protein BT96DRAFT_1025609 [Gymnopus androsaceus JB14]